MENIDFTNLQTPEILKLESLIGKEKDITHQLILYLKTHLIITPDILPICGLLLIENKNSVIEVIQNILINNPHLVDGFITNLQSSKFYNQRCAVPKIITKISNTKKYLIKSFEDDIGLVVKEAVVSLREYDEIPLTDNELLNIALYLNTHQFDFLQCLVPDILIYIKQKTFLISEISLSKSWRKRLALVRNVSYYKLEDKINLYNLMSKDPEEAVRVALVDQIECLDDFKQYAEIFIRDSSENVRKNIVKKIGNLYDDLLYNVVNDPSWLVRKELLCIHREDIYEKISLPIIQSLPKNNTWRIRIEILDTILHIVHHNDLLVQRHLLDTLFQYLIDPVYEVRNKACLVLKDLIKKAEWSNNLEEKLRCLLQSSYLIRISLVESYLSYDKKYGTKFIIELLQDKVLNVQSKVLNVLKREDLDEEMIQILRNIKCDDLILQKDIKRLLD